MIYFSEKEEGERPRDDEDVNKRAWNGVKARISSLVKNGSFGSRYPDTCPDGSVTAGTHEVDLWQAMQAEIPELQECPWNNSWNSGVHEDLPPTLAILDMIEFCWRSIGKPIQVGGYHSYFGHFHLKFDLEAGQKEFCQDINQIFRRNGLAYQLMDEGHIERLLPPVLREELTSAHFHTGDSELDRMLETARSKLHNPGPTTRREALKALWDAWERLKTTGNGQDKKTQVKNLLDATAGPSSPQFRCILEQEAKELTRIGNDLLIRHSETTKEPLAKDAHVDYLFHRLFSLITVIQKTDGQS